VTRGWGAEQRKTPPKRGRLFEIQPLRGENPPRLWLRVKDLLYFSLTIGFKRTISRRPLPDVWQILVSGQCIVLRFGFALGVTK
jgi:hypothetical protein